MAARVVVFELNEIPYRVIDDYVARHPCSHWADVMRRGARFQAATPDTGQLHPKISWQTFHRGVPDHEHGFLEYNQKDAPGAENCPLLWERLRAAGTTVGVGASIGSWPVPMERTNVAFHLPDPFAPDNQTIPDRLSAFQRLNTLAVSRSGRNVRRGGLGMANVASLLANLATLGISAHTCLTIARQLIDERVNAARIVRRRNIQALMSFDVVLAQIKRRRPQFSTLFSNHVASSMHRYWAAAYPQDYANHKMPAQWVEAYRGEIDASMQHADTMLGKLVQLARRERDLRVLVVGSMGQAAIEHEVERDQLIIRDFDRFMSALGFRADQYTRLNGMEPEYVVDFNQPADADRFREMLDRLDIDGDSAHVKPATRTQTTFSLLRNNCEFHDIGIEGKRVALADAGMVIDPIQDMTGSTAQHVPVGCCVVFDGQGDLSELGEPDTEYDLTRVTASVLAAFDVPTGAPLRSPIESLVRALDAGRTSVEGEGVAGLEAVHG